VWWAGPGGYSVIEELYQNDANELTEEISPAWRDARAGGQRYVMWANTVPSVCSVPKMLQGGKETAMFTQRNERDSRFFRKAAGKIPTSIRLSPEIVNELKRSKRHSLCPPSGPWVSQQ